MRGITTNPGARPRSSPKLIYSPTPTPSTLVISRRAVKRQEDTTKITITQTLPRPSSTRTATATLHGDLPSDPPAPAPGGVSDKQLGVILGATFGTVVGLIVIGCWLFRRRPRKRPSSRSPRRKPSPYSSPASSPTPSAPRPPTSTRGRQGFNETSNYPPPGSSFSYIPSGPPFTGSGPPLYPESEPTFQGIPPTRFQGPSRTGNRDPGSFSQGVPMQTAEPAVASGTNVETSAGTGYKPNPLGLNIPAAQPTGPKIVDVPLPPSQPPATHFRPPFVRDLGPGSNRLGGILPSKNKANSTVHGSILKPSATQRHKKESAKASTHTKFEDSRVRDSHAAVPEEPNNNPGPEPIIVSVNQGPSTAGKLKSESQNQKPSIYKTPGPKHKSHVGSTHTKGSIVPTAAYGHQAEYVRPLPSVYHQDQGYPDQTNGGFPTTTESHLQPEEGAEKPYEVRDVSPASTPPLARDIRANRRQNRRARPALSMPVSRMLGVERKEQKTKEQKMSHNTHRHSKK